MPIEIELVLRVVMATGLGAVIGYQRERAHKNVGLRTSMLVCLGAATFTVASIYGFGNIADPSRVAAGIVVGIGFLGAGTIILREGRLLEGLTTAATIWALAGMGMVTGAGMYILAVVIGVLILIILMLPHPIR
ncbi:MAG: MgtC/SapB family protein [Dehalococcoidales bacterium]|nr:MgtC/SapB family protein [Dehalococcoidales bacterium]